MRKKITKPIQLVLITAALASCGQAQQQPKEGEGSQKQRVFMRADSTAAYTEVTDKYQKQQTNSGGMGSAFIWYMAFRHLGGGLGYGSNSIHHSSVVGTNVNKASAFAASRGGFGKSARMSKSSSFGS